ncbi:MAG: type II toxin-antitoxin system VapC family toxin [Candidatus Micrarchaeota archaeon]
MYYLDTNVLAYATENHQLYGKDCKRILFDIELKKIKAFASIQVLSEFLNVLVKFNRILEKDGKTKLNLGDNVAAVLALPINWIDLSFPVIKKAATYDFRISGPDYIHIASMELFSVKLLLSADKELDKVDFVRRIDPLDYK